MSFKEHSEFIICYAYCIYLSLNHLFNPRTNFQKNNYLFGICEYDGVISRMFCKAVMQ